jgi:hypothetical protein
MRAYKKIRGYRRRQRAKKLEQERPDGEDEVDGAEVETASKTAIEKCDTDSTKAKDGEDVNEAAAIAAAADDLKKVYPPHPGQGLLYSGGSIETTVH